MTDAQTTATAAGEAARIRWLCRRGMKELDVLLELFFHSEYAQLDATGQGVFRQLLEYEDPALYAILVGGAVPESRDQAAMAARIRACPRA
ncbi:MAG: succinate dehydrogenase assembly factor 2 [Salinisphaera sp.]|nr:succinate dehydrogenase assembly factor 2 [Salinisphaera sp.]